MQGSVTYQLPSDGLTWSSVFRQLEANKERLGIIDYSVSQTTLEQVSPLYKYAKSRMCIHVQCMLTSERVCILECLTMPVEEYNLCCCHFITKSFLAVLLILVL